MNPPIFSLEKGGAGTFSDGKLMTRINDGFCRTVLEEFVTHGAPKEILADAKPHIGTDRLRTLIVAIRKEIISLGGEVRFHSPAEDLIVKDGKIAAVVTRGEKIPCDCLILAPGNAARPLFSCCLAREIAIESKPFSVGARIEHLQEAIDAAMYGDYAGHPGWDTQNTSSQNVNRKRDGQFTPFACVREA